MTEPPKRPKRETPVTLAPVFIRHATAAAMLDISERQLDRIVAARRLQKRELTPGCTGYLRRDIEALAESLPALTPGVRATPADPQAA